MARSPIILNLFKISYTVLAAFAQVIHDGFVSLVADYAAPNPTMPIFQGDIDDLNARITAWGIKGNRGSHEDHVKLLAAANKVKDDLRMLADYAQNKKPNDPDSWTALGFKVKRAKSKPVRLQQVQNLHQFIARDIPAPWIKIRWKRPLNTQPGEAKGYIVQRSNIDIQPQIDGHAIINCIGIVTSVSFIDDDPLVGTNYYWVTPFNSIGFGVSSFAAGYQY